VFARFRFKLSVGDPNGRPRRTMAANHDLHFSFTFEQISSLGKSELQIKKIEARPKLYYAILYCRTNVHLWSLVNPPSLPPNLPTVVTLTGGTASSLGLRRNTKLKYLPPGDATKRVFGAGRGNLGAVTLYKTEDKIGVVDQASHTPPPLLYALP
jgi:hypothetical protein